MEQFLIKLISLSLSLYLSLSLSLSLSLLPTKQLTEILKLQYRLVNIRPRRCKTPTPRKISCVTERRWNHFIYPEEGHAGRRCQHGDETLISGR